MTNTKEDKTTWAIGGGLLSGLGAGFFFLSASPALYFVGSIIAGLGIGLIITSVLSVIKRRSQ